MAGIGEPSDDEHIGEETAQGSSALEKFLKAAIKVANVEQEQEHESSLESLKAPSICDLKDFLINDIPTKNRLKLVKKTQTESSSTVLSFEAKEKTEQISKKSKKGIK